MSMKKDEYRKGVTTVKLNVKDWVRDTWLIKQGHELILAMLMRYGEPTPYNVISAVFGLNVSDTHETPCRLIDLYLPTKDQVDFFTPTCVECGAVIPINVFAEPFDADYCFRCKSAVRRELIAI
jgi:hypothetical protein